MAASQQTCYMLRRAPLQITTQALTHLLVSVMCTQITWCCAPCCRSAAAAMTGGLVNNTQAARSPRVSTPFVLLPATSDKCFIHLRRGQACRLCAGPRTHCGLDVFEEHP